MTFWADAVAEAWSVFNAAADSMLPVIGLALGLGLLGSIFGLMVRKD